MSLTAGRTTSEFDFALIGHQESWRAAADVLAVLRGTPLPDDEIKDILPWIPPRPVCHVEVGSIEGTKARGLYIDSFIPPDRLDAGIRSRKHRIGFEPLRPAQSMPERRS